MEPLKIVARYADGRIVKGFTNDFFTDKSSFHIFKNRLMPSKGENIVLNELKAVFIVKDFRGSTSYVESKALAKGQTPHGRMVKVIFKDAETLVGATTSYDTRKPGFFLFPIDPQGNNLRAFVMFSAVKEVQFL